MSTWDSHLRGLSYHSVGLSFACFARWRRGSLAPHDLPIMKSTAGRTLQSITYSTPACHAPDEAEVLPVTQVFQGAPEANAARDAAPLPSNAHFHAEMLECHKAVTRNTGRRECRSRHATSAQRHAPQGHRVVVVHANHLLAPVLSSLAWRHSSKLSKTQSVRYVLTRTLHPETVSSERLVRSSNGLQPQAQ